MRLTQYESAAKLQQSKKIVISRRRDYEICDNFPKS
jgi:hypothetical protein